MDPNPIIDQCRRAIAAERTGMIITTDQLLEIALQARAANIAYGTAWDAQVALGYDDLDRVADHLSAILDECHPHKERGA